DRAVETRNLIVQIGIAFAFGGLLVAAAILGIIRWSRRQYTARLFVTMTSAVFMVSTVRAVNNWPTVQARLLTAVPLAIQIGGLIAVGLIGLILIAGLVGLAFGALPRRLAAGTTLSSRDASRLGIAAGLIAAAVMAGASQLATPVWAHTTDVD